MRVGHRQAPTPKAPPATPRGAFLRVYNEAMDERRRRYYLTALGIDPWCARWPLPGGAPSPECPPEPVEPVQPAKPAVSLRGEAAPGWQSGAHGERASLDAVRDALETQEAAAPPEALPEESAAAASPTPDSVLNAMVWHDDRFSLMASAPEGLSTERQNRLGRNLLRALGASGETDATRLRWPPFDNPELPGNNGDNFQRVLDRLMEGGTSGRWVILGPEVNKLVGQHVTSAQHEIVLAAEQTLGELLAEPAAKRALWEQMQPLVHHGADR